MVRHVADRLLGGAQHRRAFLHQPFGEIGDRVLELFRRHREIDHADAGGLLAVERIAEAGVIERVARQHRVGHRLGHQRTGQDAPVHLGQRERRVLGGDGEVAGQKLHERAADAVAMHHGDGRLVVLIEPLPAPSVGGRGGLLAFAGVLLQLAEELLEILAGAEVAALAAHHDDLDVLIDLEPGERVVHVVVQAAGSWRCACPGG